DGAVDGVLVHGVDVTEQVLARREIEAAVRARDEFLSVAAHEMRTPVTSLRGFAQLVLRQLDRGGAADPERGRHALAEGDRQTRRRTEVRSRLLDAPGMEAGRRVVEPRPTDLGTLVEQAAESVRRAAPGRVVTIAADGPIAALVDPPRFEQVLVNLL